MKRREMLAGLGALAAAPARAQDADLGAIARDAWLFGLPLIEISNTMARALRAPGARMNRLNHARELAGPESRGVTTPNNDTLYSTAWVDLSQGPLTFTLPPTGKRYISVACMNMYSDNEILFGTRTDGGKGGTYTLVGPGRTAAGRNVHRLSTPHGWLLVRTVVEGPDDLQAVHRVQDALRLEGPEGRPPPRPTATRQSDALTYFAALGELLKAEPPPGRDAPMMRRIAPLANVQSARFTEAAVKQMEAGVADARAALRAAANPKAVQGWSYPSSNLGNFGTDYAFRAAVALGGLAALPPAEAMYMNPVGDKGRLFTGPGPYRLHFPNGRLPPVDAFWSLTMYEATPEGQFFLVPNAAKRYSIGDRTPGLRTNPDGSLDIWIARQDPGPERRANWLPAPAQGPFTLSFRAYLPKRELLRGRYRLPAITHE